MNTRPDLKIGLNANEFNQFYYLKEELVSFCRDNGIATIGGKVEISERNYIYLDTGIKVENVKKMLIQNNAPEILSLDTRIETNIKCSETHRAFFKSQLAKIFSFNVIFQRWLKANSGKTYGEACDAYLVIKEEKKKRKTVIDKQFKYNTYIRGFFETNKGLALSEAIKCWKYKKELPGHNKYEHSDLTILV